MTQDEAIQQTKDAYVADLITYNQFERFIDKALNSRYWCMHEAVMALPFTWEIRDALASTHNQ
jgi:hypothetical protein